MSQHDPSRDDEATRIYPRASMSPSAGASPSDGPPAADPTPTQRDALVRRRRAPGFGEAPEEVALADRARREGPGIRMAAHPAAEAPRSALQPGVSGQGQELAGRFGPTLASANPLIGAAMPLLLVAARLHAIDGDSEALYAHAIEGVRRFEAVALDADVAEEDVAAARYALCAFLDEQVLSTPWGGESAWSSRSLLNVFHNETWGGEKVFEILHRAKASNPERYVDLIEFISVVVALGFEGRYKVIRNGRALLSELRDDIYATLRPYIDDQPIDLSKNWQGQMVRRIRQINLPIWISCVATLIVLAGTYGFFETSLSRLVAPAAADLRALTEDARIGQLDPTFTLPAREVRRSGEASSPRIIETP